MPEITVKVRNKRAEVIGSPVIVCGNSDYTIAFDLDEEWASLGDKVARYEFWDKGELKYTLVQFTGTTARVPVLYDVTEVAIILYAGDIHTGEPARIPCIRSLSRAAANRPDTRVIISESSGDIVMIADGYADETIGIAEQEA
jgi:hypothetical protein